MRALTRSLSLLGIMALVLSACGQGPAPAATPTTARASPVPQATATLASQAATPSPAASAGISGQDQVKALASLPYSLEKAKAMVAQRFYIAGMSWGLGEEPKYGGIATFTHRLPFPCGDPAACPTVSIHGATNSVMGGGALVRPKESSAFEVEPNVATSWEANADFTEWTFKLRSDVKWHDGDFLTAQDVKFWADLYCFPPAGRKLSTSCANLGPLKETRVIDPQTIVFVEKRPTPALIELMTTFNLEFTHKRNLAQLFIDKGKATVQMQDLGWVSIGPFKYDRYDEASSFSVVRNPSYWKKDDKGRQLPYLDGIVNPIIPDPQTGVSAFRAGKTDRTAAGSGYHLTPNMVAAIEKSLPGKAWYARSFYSGWGVGPNSTIAPFNDVKLRKAVQLSIDREEWGQYAYGGFASVAGAMFPGSYWASADSLTWPGYNPATKKQDRAEALQIIKDGGWTGLKFGINTRDNYVFNAEAAVAEFKKLGLEANIIVLDTVINLELQQKGSFTAVLGAFGAAFPGTMLTDWRTDNPIAGNKTGDAKLNEFDSLIQTTVDPVKRRAVVKEAEYYILQEKYYYWPGPWEESTVGARTYIKGVWVGANTPLFNNAHQSVWIDPKER